MLTYLLIALAVVAALVVIFLIIVALQPSDFRITRSATISAPPAAVFAQVNDFHKWTGWSPWEKIDPNLQRTYDGPPAGKGSMYAWKGNKNVGEGRMTITESRPSDLILIKLQFIKPFAATNTTEFTFQPGKDQTAVTWTMTGKHQFMGKVFGLFMNMDKMIGNEFEKGLASMKSLAEAAK